MTVEQRTTIARMQEIYRCTEPQERSDGMVTFSYIATDSAGRTGSYPATLRPDGTYTIGRPS
jgi:hypothetical protein